MKYWFLIFSFVLLLPTSALSVPNNKLLKIGIGQEFDSIHPLLHGMLAAKYTVSMVARSLVSLDADNKWYPQLAVAIPTLENGLAQLTGKGKKRKLRVTWEIRDDARWGDGTPVTGRDAKFAWELGRNDYVSVYDRQTFEDIEKIVVDKKNPKRFTMFYKKATWEFNRLGSFYLLPVHLEGKVLKKYGNKAGGYAKNSLYSKNPTNRGLYNGPYVITDVKLGSHITVEPNRYYYGKSPKIKKIIIKLIPNTGTMESNLRSGNIDMISVVGLSLDQAINLEKKVKRKKLPFTVKFKSGYVYEHIDLMLDNPHLKDIRVRQALVYAINRKKLTEALFEGKQKPAIHNFSPMDPWYTDNKKYVSKYRTSKRRARKLLDEAGWKLGKDKYRYKDGAKLSLQLMTTAGNKLREVVQVYLQNEWRKVGINVIIKNEPPRVFFGETVRRRKYGAMAMYAWGTIPEDTFKATVHSEKIPDAKNSWSGQNYTGWINKEVDKITEEMEVTFDAKKRVVLAHEFLYHYTRDIPVIPLYYRSDIAVVPQNLVGHRLTGHSFVPTDNVEDWELR